MEKRGSLASRGGRVLRRAAVVLGISAGALLAGGVAAQALPGGPFYSSSNPQYVMNGSIRAGEMFGEFYGYREHPQYGSIMEWQTWRRQANPDNSNGAYVWSRGWTNDYNCYISSYSNAGATATCGQGWREVENWETGRHTSSAWSGGWYFYWQISPTGSSFREGSKVCMDKSWATDPCAGWVYRGGDY